VSDDTSRGPWGWDAPTRYLLILLAAAGAAGLLAVAPGQDAAAVPLPRLVVDPNTAPPEVLCALPKLGPALVARIIEARDEAPFRSLDDLDARVKGIGPATIAALRPHLRMAQDAR
jgi:competence protein ComEA